MFTKGTQAAVSQQQVPCLGLGLPPLAEDSAFLSAWLPPPCIFEIYFSINFLDLFVCFVLVLF